MRLMCKLKSIVRNQYRTLKISYRALSSVLVTSHTLHLCTSAVVSKPPFSSVGMLQQFWCPGLNQSYCMHASTHPSMCLMSAHNACRSRGATVEGECGQLTLHCLLAFVSASRHAQGHLQSRDPDKNGLLVLPMLHTYRAWCC